MTRKKRQPLVKIAITDKEKINQLRKDLKEADRSKDLMVKSLHDSIEELRKHHHKQRIEVRQSGIREGICLVTDGMLNTAQAFVLVAKGIPRADSKIQDLSVEKENVGPATRRAIEDSRKGYNQHAARERRRLRENAALLIRTSAVLRSDLMRKLSDEVEGRQEREDEEAKAKADRFRSHNLRCNRALPRAKMDDGKTACCANCQLPFVHDSCDSVNPDECYCDE